MFRHQEIDSNGNHILNNIVWNVVSCDPSVTLLSPLFPIVKDCPEEWQRGMSAGLLDPMIPMDTIFVKHVRENGPAVKAGLSTGTVVVAVVDGDS